MQFVGYDFRLDESGIKLDDELDIDKLGWKGGDYFKLINVNGKAQLIKVDVTEKFLINGVK